MTYFVSFIYGTALFYIHRFFPYTSVFISLILILLLSFPKFRKQIDCHCEEQSGPEQSEGTRRARFLTPFGTSSAIPFLLRLLRLRLAMTRKTLYIFIIAVIAVLGFYYAKSLYTPPPVLSDIAGKTIEVQGIAKSDTGISKKSQSFWHRDAFQQTIEVRKAVDEDRNDLHLRELRVFTDIAFESNKEYLIKVRIPQDTYFLNPGSNMNVISGYVIEAKEIRSLTRGIFSQLRLRLNDFIKHNFSVDSAPFVMSIITGERSLLTKETRNAFNATGLAHILSISGAHFGLLLFILFRIFKLLVRMFPHNILVRLTIYLTPSQIAAILCVPFMIAYLGISDMSIPSIRAFIMITLFLFGLLIHRKGFWLNTLLFAAVVIILIQPDSILDLSLQLSFIAVLCIGLTTEQKSRSAEEQKNDNLKRNYFHNVTSGLLLFCTSALKISLAATIGTAPLVAYHFHYFSLISPITNLIITPIIGFVILPIAIVSSFIFLAFGVFPLHSFVDAITIFVLKAIKHIAQWNFVDIKIPAFPLILLIMFYIGVLVYVIVKMQNRQGAIGDRQEEVKKSIAYRPLPITIPVAVAIIPMLVYAGIKFFEPRKLKITHLDVGQGDSAVVELPDSRTLVIDTGRRGIQTAEFLRYRGIKKIDAIILSHGQSDHAGGIWYLLKNFKVHEIWDNGRLIYPDESLELKHRGLQRGDVIEGKGYKITVLHPYDGFYTLYSDDNDENNDSLVLKIQDRRNVFLFTGDIEEEAEEDLSYLGGHIKSSVLKVPHHGSRTSLSEMFFNTVSPEIAVISVGRKNLYNHPHRETLEMLNSAKIFRTDRDGAICIEELPDGRLEVKTWKDMQLAEALSIKEELMNFKKLFLVW